MLTSPIYTSPLTLQSGTVTRLNRDVGFGYVLDQWRLRQYIFVFGAAIKHSQTGQLAVGKPVMFRLGDEGRVEQLIPA